MTFREALVVVEETKKRIQELDAVLPGPVTESFRKRLLAELERQDADVELRNKARRLLQVYRDEFGVKDLTDPLDPASNFD